jgi:enoyl-[acyl-carrier protein] reductase II
MYPEVLRLHIQKLKKATDEPFAVNLPLMYPAIEEHIQIILEQKVPIVFTSAGNPKIWTTKLKQAGIVVVHVIANTNFALKAVEAGVDAIVAEGFEAGGHNGKEETTTLCLVPKIVEAVQIPVIAAGGISSGKTMLAAFALGAEAVQIGSRFAASIESSAHQNFKDAIVKAQEGDTKLSLKKLTPVRLLKNEFAELAQQADLNGATVAELTKLLGKGRAKAGIFEGDLQNGELEIGQVAANFDQILPASVILTQIWAEFLSEKGKLQSLSF